jgi:acetoin utilization protein AcuB
MTKVVMTVSPETPAETAWERMRLNRIHHLVVTRGSEIVGLISDRDAGGRRGAAVRQGRTVAELMTERPVTVSPDTPIRKAANLMRGRSVGSLVVTDSRGRLAGIVTVADLLDALGRGVEHPVSVAKRPALGHRVPHRKRHGAIGIW